MKTSILAAAVVVAGTPLLAEDGLNFGGELKSLYNVDKSTTSVTVKPSATYGMGKTELEVSSVISAFDSTATDNMTLFNTLEKGSRPTIDLSATYNWTDSLELEAKSSWDIDAAARGDITIGATFNF